MLASIGCSPDPVPVDQPPAGVLAATELLAESHRAAEQARYIASSRNFGRQGRDWRLSVGSHSVALDRSGAVLGGPDADPVAVRFSRWGRPDRLVDVGAARWQVGDCLDDPQPSRACSRPLERADGGVTEWWVGQPTGAQQGWTLHERPSGAGPLVIEVAVRGAQGLRRDGLGGARFRSGRSQWTVSSAMAWDADGRSLPVSLRLGADRLVWSIADTGAVYPVTVDPVFTVSRVLLQGSRSFGMWTRRAGDLNGDSYDDLLVTAAHSASYRDATSTLLLPGGPTGVGLNPIATVAMGMVQGAGDVDGDGVADLIGRTEDYFQLVTTLGGAPHTLGRGGGPFSKIVPAGDLNDDGFDDFATLVASPSSGSYYTYGPELDVYLGTSAGASISGRTVDSHDSCVSCYWSPSRAAGVGDLDGDGIDDLVASGEWPGAASGGDSLAVVTDATGGGGIPSVTDYVALPADFHRAGPGADVAGLGGPGDVNGDGYTDVLVLGGGSATLGTLTGAATGLSSALAWSTTLTASGHGFDLTTADDVDGDGHIDLALDDGERVSVWFGDGFGFGSAAGWTSPERPASLYRRAGRGGLAGDLDGDGFGDVTWGANILPAAIDRFYVAEGSATGLPATASATLTDPEQELPPSPTVRQAVGDLDGDSWDDLLLQAERASGDVDTWFYGGVSGGFQLRGVVSTDCSNNADGLCVQRDPWIPLGDVNGDGADEVVHAGKVYEGSVNGPTLSTVEVVDPGSESDWQAAGDLDADGYADFARLNVTGDPTTGATGVAWLYYGSASGIPTTATTTLEGWTHPDWVFGGQPALATGDLDEDGYDDLLFYGRNVETGYTAPARKRAWAQVHRGAAGGASPTPSTSQAWSLFTTVSVSLIAAADQDFDGDGHTDGLIGEVSPGVTLINVVEYAGGAWSIARVSSPCVANPIDIGDVTGDGRSDVVCEDRGGASGLSLGDLSGTTTPLDASESVEPTAVSSYDLDGDGRLELVGFDSGAQQALRAWSISTDADNDGFYDDVDCDDTDPVAYPGAASAESPTACMRDADGDGFGDPAPTSSAVTPGTDCDDRDPAAFPGAEEFCNGVDDDCDGVVDGPDSADVHEWYRDADGDGYTDPDDSMTACEAASGYADASDMADCDDADPTVFPGAEEVPGDGIDQDCDGEDEVEETGDGGEEGPTDTGSGDDGGSKSDGACATAAPGGAGGALAVFAMVVAARRRP